MGIKLPGHEADHSPSVSTVVKNECSCTSTLHMTSLTSARGHRYFTNHEQWPYVVNGGCKDQWNTF